MQDETKNDVNLNVVGTGCATSCATGCLSFLVLLVAALAMGLRAAGASLVLHFLGFTLAILGYAIVGYVVARRAREEDVPVNVHILVVGVLIMIFGLLSFVLPQRASPLITAQSQSLGQLFNVIAWLVVIPAMLVGARWREEDES